MLVPEIIIFQTVSSLIGLLKEDYESDTSTNKDKNILYKLLKTDDNGMEMFINKFNYLEQGVSIFVTNQNPKSSRKLEISMGYNTERASLPTIHILLPNENKYDIGIGMGEGYEDDELTDYIPATLTDPEVLGTVTKRLTSAYKSNYSLLITSDNSSECVLIYHVLKNLMFSTFSAFELCGLRDVEFGGQDLQFTNEFVPPNVFHRSLAINFFYESSVSSLITETLVSKLKFIGTPIQ